MPEGNIPLFEIVYKHAQTLHGSKVERTFIEI